METSLFSVLTRKIRNGRQSHGPLALRRPSLTLVAISKVGNPQFGNPRQSLARRSEKN
jgi:hypothetical protein